MLNIEKTASITASAPPAKKPGRFSSRLQDFAAKRISVPDPDQIQVAINPCPQGLRNVEKLPLRPITIVQEERTPEKIIEESSLQIAAYAANFASIAAMHRFVTGKAFDATLIPVYQKIAAKLSVKEPKRHIISLINEHFSLNLLQKVKLLFAYILIGSGILHALIYKYVSNFTRELTSQYCSKDQTQLSKLIFHASDALKITSGDYLQKTKDFAALKHDEAGKAAFIAQEQLSISQADFLAFSQIMADKLPKKLEIKRIIIEKFDFRSYRPYTIIGRIIKTASLAVSYFALVILGRLFKCMIDEPYREFVKNDLPRLLAENLTEFSSPQFIRELLKKDEIVHSINETFVNILKEELAPTKKEAEQKPGNTSNAPSEDKRIEENLAASIENLIPILKTCPLQDRKEVAMTLKGQSITKDSLEKLLPKRFNGNKIMADLIKTELKKLLTEGMTQFSPEKSLNIFAAILSSAEDSLTADAHKEASIDQEETCRAWDRTAKEVDLLLTMHLEKGVKEGIAEAGVAITPALQDKIIKTLQFRAKRDYLKGGMSLPLNDTFVRNLFINLIHSANQTQETQ